MPSRYGLCKIVDGTVVPPGIPVEEIPLLSYRAQVLDLAYQQSTNAVSWLGPSLPSGAPAWRFAFFHVSTVSLGPVLALPNCLVFPDYPLDAEMGGMDFDTRIGLEQSIGAYNLDGNGLRINVLIGGISYSYRAFVTQIAQQFEPAFNADRDQARPVGDG